MYPILFELGPLRLSAYGAGVGAGLLLAMYLASRWSQGREDLPKDLFWTLGLIAVVGGVVGARLEYVRVHLAEFVDEPARILAVQNGGVVFHGGLLLASAGLIAYLSLKKLPVLNILDYAAPATAFALGVARLGCFGAGCCYGGPTDLPWAVTFTDELAIAPTGVALHPTQLYASIYATGFGAFLYGRLLKKRFDGEIVLLFFTIYPVLRSINEVLRSDDKERGWFLEDLLGQTLSTAQGVSVLLALGALLGWVVLLRRAKGSTPDPAASS